MGDSDPESSANPKIENKASDEAAATTTAAAAAVANDSISEEELSIREWLASLFSEPKFTATDPRVSLQTLLGDGVLVCQLANKIKKGSVARINPPNALRFMLVENIRNYCQACRNFGVPQSVVFKPQQLSQGTGIPIVINNLICMRELLETGDMKKSKERFASVASPTVTATEPASAAAPPATRKKANSKAPSPTVASSEPAPAPSGAAKRDPSPIPVESPRTQAAVLAYSSVKPTVTTFEEDMKMKEELKYSTALEDSVKEWIRAVLENPQLFTEKGVSFLAALKSGVILCELINKLAPGTIPKIVRKTLAYAQMDNITNFRNACEKLGMQSTVLFSTSDLFEGRNGGRVLDTLLSLARHAVSKGLTTIAIKEVTESSNLFMQALTEEFHVVTDEEAAKTPCAPEHSSLLKWANEKLAEKNVVLYNFSNDVKSGLKLLTLAEVVSKEDCWERRFDPPTSLQECMKNACVLFNFLEQRKNSEITCCSPQDVLSENAERVSELVAYMRDEFDLDYIFKQMCADEEAMEGEEQQQLQQQQQQVAVEQQAQPQVQPEVQQQPQVQEQKVSEVEEKHEAAPVEPETKEAKKERKKREKERKKKEKEEKKKHHHHHRHHKEESVAPAASAPAPAAQTQPEKPASDVPASAQAQPEKPTAPRRQVSTLLLGVSGSMQGVMETLSPHSPSGPEIVFVPDKKPQAPQPQPQAQPQQPPQGIGAVPSGLRNSQRENMVKAQVRMRQRIAKEILSTEESYTTGLETMCTKVVQPLIDLSKEWNGSKNVSKPLSEDEIRGIFCNAFELLEDHQVFLKKVKARMDDWSDDKTTLGDLFLEQLPILHHYGPYLQGYAPAAAALHYLSQHHLPTKTFVERFEVEQYKINRLNVPSFLVMPVQRLPRYVLLLSDLKKYTPENHPDIPFLTELLPKLQATVSELNKGIDPEKELNMKKTISVAEAISGDGVEDIVRGERKFLKEGALKWCAISSKTGKEKSAHKGYCFLFNNLIVLCVMSGKKDKPYVLKRLIHGTSIVNVLCFNKAQSIRINHRPHDAETTTGSNSHPPSPMVSSTPAPAAPAPEPEPKTSSVLDTFSALSAIRSEVSGAQLLINQNAPALGGINNLSARSVKKTQKGFVIKLTSSEECREWESNLMKIATDCRDADSLTGSTIASLNGSSIAQPSLTGSSIASLTGSSIAQPSLTGSAIVVQPPQQQQQDQKPQEQPQTKPEEQQPQPQEQPKEKEGGEQQKQQ